MDRPEADQGSIEWRPEWEGEDQQRYEEAKARMVSQVSNFRGLRSALGLSQVEAAKQLETTQANVSKIEAKSNPTLSTIRKLVEGRGTVRVIVETDDGETIELTT